MRNTILSFGLIIFSVLVLFQIAKFNRFESGLSSEFWIAAFSILFLLIGLFVSKKLQKEKIVEKEVYIEQEKIVESPVFIYKDSFEINTRKVEQLNITRREYEVLELICKGLSNQQIAQTMFVTESTVKKHVTSLFIKLDVERRTEAIRKARDFSLVNQ